jgi:3-methyladenine DNA glycosylase AlkD
MADPPSPATARARSLVAKRKGEARTLGTRAAEEATDPAAAAGILRVGLAGLADPEYLAGLQRVAPGIGPTLGVRQPLLTAVGRSLRRGLRSDSSAVRLDLAERLLREEPLELHWLAFGILEQAIVADPERAWQLVRGEARKANDWITVDSLAHVAGRGILAEPYRWSELEQLVYSPSGWERRLVGSTIATIPSLDRDAGRQPAIATRGLTLVTELIGDAQPEVQKALSWALRSLTLVDREATIAFLDREADATRTRDDGLRARVVRDSLEKLPPDVAERLRTKVAGVRTRPRAPSSSRAAATAAAFMGVGLEVPPPESHVIDRS